ncbi:MAG TPA: ATP-binding protein [Fimbriimonadaceae bacterium]|nr:ATP-binding protein [Fimbriimonadaceae bacterium]
MQADESAAGGTRKNQLIKVALAVGLTVLVIVACEPFFPTTSVRGNPGAIYWVSNALIAYFLGWGAGLFNALLLCVHMALGPMLPASAFERTPENEIRIVASAIIFGGTSIFIGAVSSKLRRARAIADAEAQQRRQAEHELQESERLRNLVLECTMDAVIATDEQGRVVFWNRNAERLLGWRAQETVGRALPRSLLGGEATDSTANFPELASPRRDITAARPEVSIQAKDGSLVDAEVYAVTHETDRGKLHIAFIRDISERKRSHQAILELNESLEQRVEERTSDLLSKNEELEGFTYAVSHDMRSPLRAIVANARIVLEEEGTKVSPAGRTNLERLVGAALKMSMLVDDLLQYARVGNRVIRREPVDVSSLAASVAREVGAQHPRARITVQPGLRAECDSMLLSMVLANLFDNGCKYAEDGAAARVRFTQVDADGEPAYLVSDNGIGIDMQYSDKLFRPFERLHRDQDYPGTGIGLANVRRAVERHGGRVWIESAVGRGTRVFFTLGPEAIQPVEKHAPEAVSFASRAITEDEQASAARADLSE